jgi:TorA maturation chaperone TorD
MDVHNHEHNILKGYNMLLYFAGSMVLYEPSEECVVDFWRNGILKNLPVSSTNPTFIKAASQLRNSCEDLTGCLVSLRNDYRKLLGSKESSLAPAYESVYHKNGPVTSDPKKINVSDFYNSYGWISKFGKSIDDDNLGVELLFLTLLIDKYLALDDEVCSIEMRTEIKRFIDKHLLSWLPQWNRKIQNNADTICYKGIASLVLACSEDLLSIFSNNNAELKTARNFKN